MIKNFMKLALLVITCVIGFSAGTAFVNNDYATGIPRLIATFLLCIMISFVFRDD